MKLYEKWLKLSYNEKGESNAKVWDDYLPLEQKTYETMLKTKRTNYSGTIKELSKELKMREEYVCGFIDGINDATKKPLNIEEITEDTYIDLDIDFRNLYKLMVEYKADHLYNLREWDNLFTEEEREELFKEQKTSKTFVREEAKVGRNDPCTCGSGKKYKKCCGLK